MVLVSLSLAKTAYTTKMTKPPVVRAKSALARLSFVALFLLHFETAVGDLVASATVGAPVASDVPVGSIAQADTAKRDDAVKDEILETAAAPAVHTPEDADGPIEVISHRAMFADVLFVDELLSVEAYKERQQQMTKTKRPTIIMLYSAWCHHCFMYRKTFMRLAEDLHDKFDFAALNCVENSAFHQICADLNVLAFPSIKLLVPASIHLKLPLDAQQVKVRDPTIQYVFDELHRLKLGGFLDSFNAKNSNSFAVHTLALPSEDILLAVKYAAKNTLQEVSIADLKKTLGPSLIALDHLRGKRCEAPRWQSEEILPFDLLQNDDEMEIQGMKNLAITRVHDGIRGLQLFLASWVVTPADKMSRADAFALIDFLELVRATVPLKEVKHAATLAILYLYRGGSSDNVKGKVSVILNAVNGGFTDQFYVYRGLDQGLQEASGMQAASFREFIGNVSFGAEFPPLPPLVEPKLKHCKTQTCSIWMLLHFLAEGSLDLAEHIIEHPKCDFDNVFYKRKAQALPVFLLRQQQANGSKLGDAEILRIATMTTDELIKYDGKLGCGIVPAFDVAYYIYNVLDRFLSCSECREHFRMQFEHLTHGLAALRPPEGHYTLYSPGVVAAADEQFLLEQYRSQPENMSDSWSSRREEKRKLNNLKLWLWRLHNAVNVRTAMDSTLAFVKGDEEAKNYVNCDARWPPFSACKRCRLPGASPRARISVDVLAARGENLDIFAIEEIVKDFNEPHIRTYLKETYWPASFQTE